MGFKFQIVLADSLYGESGDFIEALNHNQLKFVVAIRSNHSVLMPQSWRVRYTTWKSLTEFSRMEIQEVRYQRNSFWQTANIRYWQITTDKVELQRILLGLLWLIYQVTSKSVSNTYGLELVEYGFKQVKMN